MTKKTSELKKTTAKLIKENAEKINQYHKKIDETFSKKASNPDAWEKACEIFHSTYDALAFPGGLNNELSSLRNQKPEAIDAALIYLEADPVFHRSGYIKQELLKLLKKIKFSANKKREIQSILIKAINTDGKREFREYCRLARVVQDHKFIDTIRTIIENSDDKSVISRAKLMLTTMES